VFNKCYKEIATKAAWEYGGEAWKVNKNGTKRLEATQMRHLQPLCGITRLNYQQYAYFNFLF
jgi:hypothetical protein